MLVKKPGSKVLVPIAFQQIFFWAGDKDSGTIWFSWSGGKLLCCFRLCIFSWVVKERYYFEWLMLKESAHSLKRCKKNIYVLEKSGMITRQNAWFANQEPIYLLCTKIMVI